MCDKKFNRTASLQGTWNRNNISNISCFKASKKFEGTFYVISMQLQNLKEQRRTHVCVSFACGENIRFFVMSFLQIPPSIWKTNVQAKKSESFITVGTLMRSNIIQSGYNWVILAWIRSTITDIMSFKAGCSNELRFTHVTMFMMIWYLSSFPEEFLMKIQVLSSSLSMLKSQLSKGTSYHTSHNHMESCFFFLK